uniref:Uncharacterized protein n=1 Tax=Globodera rostochiensis TaxID=31243 RepID=A0A914I393_GLORO
MPRNTWKHQIEQRIDELENRSLSQERQLRDLRCLALHAFHRLERVESWASRENWRPFRPRYAPYIGPLTVCAREQQRRQRVNGAIVADHHQLQQHACRCTICLRHRRVEDRLASGEAAVSAQRQQIQAEQNHLEAGTSHNNNASNNNNSSGSNAGPSQNRNEGSNNNNNNNGNLSLDEQFDPCGCHQWQCEACEEARRMNRLRSRTGRPHGPRTASEGLMLRDRREEQAEQSLIIIQLFFSLSFSTA